MRKASKNTKTLILGVGNLLMGDEGVGIHLIQSMEKEVLPDEVEILDGGTAGLSLLNNVEGFDHIIVVDASLDNRPPGTIRVIKPKFLQDFPPSMSTHDLGLKNVIEGSQFLGRPLNVTLVVVSINKVQPMQTGLSAEIQQIIADLIVQIKKLLT